MAREARTQEADYQEQPKTIRWTYIEYGERYTIPFQLNDCQIPDVYWNLNEKRKAQPASADDAATRAPEE